MQAPRRNRLFAPRLLAIYGLAAIIVAAIFHCDLLVRLAVSDSQKIGMPLLSSRTDPGDNYLYFSLIKRGAGACRRFAEPAATEVDGNALACTYLGGVLTGHLLFRLSGLLVRNPRIALSLTLVLNTALLAFTFLVAFSAIVDRGLSLAASTALAGATLYVSDNFSLSFYFGQPYLNFSRALGIEPNLVRLMNPTVTWSLGFATLAALLAHLRRPDRASLALALLFAAICSTASVAVAATLAAGFGLFVVASLLATRQVNWSVLAVVGVLGLGLAWTMVQFRLFYATQIGSELQHGQFSGVRFNPAFLTLALPAAIGRINSTDGERDLLMKCILIAAAIVGALCDSVELGSRLWIRGAAAFALLACVAWVWTSAESLAQRAVLLSGVRPAAFANLRQRRCLAAASTTACASTLLIAVLYVKPVCLDGWRGFLDRDKYDVLTWLDDRVKSGMTVASTNIEDSFLVDFYTQGSAFVPLYGLTALPWPEQMRRYFYTIDQIEEGRGIFDRLSMVTKEALYKFHVALSEHVKEPFDYASYQSLAFYHMLTYYPYNALTQNLFASGKPDERFLQWLGELREEALRRSYSYRYLIVRVSERLKAADRFEEVYRNASYVVLRPKVSGGGRTNDP
jgi:hypothetical protein